MVSSEYKNIFPENNKKPHLPETMGILTANEYKKKYCEEIENRLDFHDLKDDFKGICDRLNKNKKIIFSKIINILTLNVDYKNILLDIEKKDFESFSLKDIEKIFYKIEYDGIEYKHDKVLINLYADYLGYSDLIKQSKNSLFILSYEEIQKYILIKSNDLLDNDDREELLGEIIDEIEDRFDNIDFGDKYLFEKIFRMIEDIKLNFIVAGNLFKELKNDEVNTLDDLKNIGIDYKKINTNNLSKIEKGKLLDDLMVLYYKNYDEKFQKDFLYEIKNQLKQIIENKLEEDFYLFYIDGELALSLYFKQESKNTLYMGGFNASNIFQQYSFGFWVLERILKEKKDKNIKAGILTKVDGFKKWGYEGLLKKYEKIFGFKKGKIKIFGDGNEYIEILKIKSK